MRLATRVLLSVGTIGAHVLVSFTLADGPSTKAPLTTVPVVIALRDFAEGDRIDRSDVVVSPWPAMAAPAGAYRSLDEVAGLITGTPVFKGEAIVPRRLAGLDPRHTNYPKIAPGKRAMSFRVDEVFGLAGLIQPNSRVDLLLVGERDGKKRFAKLFMENLRVLALSSVPTQWEDRSKIDAAWIATVEVTPDEGERLSIALTQGEIQFTLRNSVDLPSSPQPLGDVDSQPEPTRRATPTPPLPTPPQVRHAVILRS